MTEASSSTTGIACPVCDSRDVAVFLDLPDIPVYCNVLWPTRQQAIEAPRADMRLGFCRSCTHIFNTAFDPSLVTYAESYENSLQFSPRYRAYAESQARHLIDRYGLRGRVAVDIGCGQGDFLKLICEVGGLRGIGLDPTLAGAQGSRSVCGPITFIRDTYSERYASLDADLVCCRQVLEHVQAPRELLATVRRAVAERPQTTVFFEVPNGLFTLRDGGIWDLIYEHFSYFTPGSLARAFELSGFEINDLAEAYDGQYLCIEARAAPSAPSSASRDLDGVPELVADFGAMFSKCMTGWRERLARMGRGDERAAVWGAGSKGVSFLNAVKPAEPVRCVVDISPRKRGLHVAGTGHKVIAPDDLGSERIDKIIVMNPIYRGEIESSIRALGLTAELICM